MRLDDTFLLVYKVDVKMLTTKEAAEALGISVRQVQTLIERNKLPAQKFGRDYSIQESDLELVADRPKGRPPKPKEAMKKAKAKQK